MTYGFSYRSALLASTVLTDRISRLDVEETFGTSAHIMARYAWAEPAAIALAIRRLCHIAGVSDEVDIERLSHQKLHVHQLREFERHVERLRPHPDQDDLGSALRRFDAAQAMFTVTPNKFDTEAARYSLVTQVMRIGAEALFELGKAQFLKLADLTADLICWAKAKKHKKIAIIESPLGNCLPCAVIHEALTNAGLDAEVVSWGCPRNDRTLFGDTVRKSAERLAADSTVSGADCVLFVDDAITGTRFLKLARALRRAVGTEKFAAVAMRFVRGRGFRAADQRDLSEVEEWAKESGLKAGVIEFPARALFVIDDGAVAAFEKEMIWADSDLVAGKRKVNIVFETLDQLERIGLDLVSPKSKYRKHLEQLWSKDHKGLNVLFTPGVVDQTFIGIGADVDIGRLFDEVREDARSVYPDDYYGVAHSPNKDEVKARWDWLDGAVLDVARQQLEGNRAGLLHNAINAINQSGVADGERNPDRDHDYGHYTLSWAPDLLALNLTLRSMVLAAVDHLGSSAGLGHAKSRPSLKG